MSRKLINVLNKDGTRVYFAGDLSVKVGTNGELRIADDNNFTLLFAAGEWRTARVEVEETVK